MEFVNIKIKKITKGTLLIFPEYATKASAGVDLCADISEPFDRGSRREYLKSRQA